MAKGQPTHLGQYGLLCVPDQSQQFKQTIYYSITLTSFSATIGVHCDDAFTLQLSPWHKRTCGILAGSQHRRKWGLTPATHHETPFAPSKLKWTTLKRIYYTCQPWCIKSRIEETRPQAATTCTQSLCPIARPYFVQALAIKKHRSPHVVPTGSRSPARHELETTNEIYGLASRRGDWAVHSAAYLPSRLLSSFTRRNPAHKAHSIASDNRRDQPLHPTTKGLEELEPKCSHEELEQDDRAEAEPATGGNEP